MSESLEMKRIPLNGTFELTARCNLQCKMCLVRIDDKRMKELGGRERTAEEWIDMARQVRDAGTIGLLITGGEPMLRPDFCEIYEAIAKMGFMITLYTNATMVTTKIMEVLKKHPPHRIGVTIYGSSSEVYEKVCGHAEAYEKMIEGMKQLITLPSKFNIRTTIIKDNVNDVDNIISLSQSFKGNMEFDRSRIVVKAPRGGISNVEECRLTPEENIHLLYGKIFDYLNEKKKNKVHKDNIKFIKTEDSCMGKNTENDIEKTFFGCQAGISQYFLSWNGKLYGCDLLGTFYTEPFNYGFNKAWKKYPESIVNLSTPYKCINCNISNVCLVCPAIRFAETGDINKIPEYVCKETFTIYNKLSSFK